VYLRSVGKLAVILLVLAAVLAVSGGAGSAAAPIQKQKPQPRIVTPGPLALTRDGRALLVGDRDLRRIVRIDLRTKRRTVVASGFPEAPVGLTHHHSGNVFVSSAERIYRIRGGRKVVVAGTGARSHTGDGGPASSATLGGAGGIDVDFDGNLVVAEYDNWIRVVEARGGIHTVAGNGSTGYAGDGGRALDAALGHPHDVIWRHDGVILIADSHNGVVRQVDAAGTIRTFAAGFAAPVVLEGGPRATVYVADAGRHAVYRVSADGRRRTRVASATVPIGLAVDDRSNVYVSELDGRKRVLRVSPRGRVTVLAAGA
jgi:sugar lactone lactonase YvrE